MKADFQATKGLFLQSCSNPLFIQVIRRANYMSQASFLDKNHSIVKNARIFTSTLFCSLEVVALNYTHFHIQSKYVATHSLIGHLKGSYLKRQNGVNVMSRRFFRIRLIF